MRTWLAVLSVCLAWIQVCAALEHATGSNADGWSFPTYSPAPVDYNDVTYVQGEFVVVGSSSAILTSSDGSKWMLQESPSVAHYSTFEFVSNTNEYVYAWSSPASAHSSGGNNDTVSGCIRTKHTDDGEFWEEVTAPLRSIATGSNASIASGVNANSLWVQRDASKDEWLPLNVNDNASEAKSNKDGDVTTIIYGDPIYNPDANEFLVVAVHLVRRGDDIIANLTTTFVHVGSAHAKDWSTTQLESSLCYGRVPKIAYSEMSKQYLLFGCGMWKSSADGHVWSDIACDQGKEAHCEDIANAVSLSMHCSRKGRCVALGGIAARAVGRRASSNHECVIVESADGGATWALTQSCGDLASIATGPHSASTISNTKNVFVITNQNLLLQSSDFGKWSDRTDRLAPHVNEVHYESSLGMLVGTSTFDNGILTSVDGKSWSSTETPLHFRRVLKFKGKLLGMTTDGVRNYIRQTDEENLGNPDAAWEIVLGNELHLVFHSFHIHEQTNHVVVYGVSNDEDGKRVTSKFTSHTGHVWNQTILQKNPQAVTVLPRDGSYIGYVKSAKSEGAEIKGNIVSSPDGIRWEDRLTAIDSECMSMAASSKTDHVVALCRCGAIYSGDAGETWKASTPALPFDGISDDNYGGLTAVSYLDGFDSFAVSGSSFSPKHSNSVFLSEFGQEWEQLDFPFAMATLGVAYHPDEGVFALVANNAVAVTSERLRLQVIAAQDGSGGVPCNASLPHVSPITVPALSDDSDNASEQTDETSAEPGTPVTLSRQDIVLLVLVAVVAVFLLVSIGMAVRLYLAHKKKTPKPPNAWSGMVNGEDDAEQDLTDALMENVDF
eukprot:TRINITY_DN3646_c0_g1_i3.p1 TRINITY_DN3646_c0_g1~~TRINITY_DN3646_c0_g1_i3.p1  ORF type:complete len:836 (-),score=145.11 TRINITY_DN3646_c0_g1_i3:48-2555(-)